MPSLLVFVDGHHPSAQALCRRGRVLDLGGVKVRIGDVFVADLCDVGLGNVVLGEEVYIHMYIYMHIHIYMYMYMHV